MSARVKWTVAGGVLVVALVAVIAWFAILSPRLSQADRLDQQAIDLETANLGLLNTYNRSIELAREAPAAAAEAQRLFAAMPQQADLPGVLEQITAAATDAGIDAEDVTTINTSVPAPVSESAETEDTGVALAQLQVSVTAVGTRDQALQFLENLQRLDRVLLVTASRLIEAPVEGARQQWSIQVTGTMFVLQSKLPDLVREVDTLLAEARVPEAPAAAD